MRGLVLASFPRSGNTYLVEQLQKALGPQFNFCESHMEEFKPAVKHNCVKTHDWCLNFQVPSHWAAVVQLREPVAAITSWFDVELAAGTVQDTASDWEVFALRAAWFYRRFAAHWRAKADLVLMHHQLMASPRAGVELAASLAGWKLPLDTALAEPIVTAPNIFRFHDERIFNQIEMITQT